MIMSRTREKLAGGLSVAATLAGLSLASPAAGQGVLTCSPLGERLPGSILDRLRPSGLEGTVVCEGERCSVTIRVPGENGRDVALGMFQAARSEFCVTKIFDPYTAETPAGDCVRDYKYLRIIIRQNYSDQVAYLASTYLTRASDRPPSGCVDPGYAQSVPPQSEGGQDQQVFHTDRSMVEHSVPTN
jgi:hypothetical protein